MIEETQKDRKAKKLIWILILSYCLIVVDYYAGKSIGNRLGVEYRFWADALFRIWIWFAPVLFVGIVLLKICIRQWKKKSIGRWILSVVLIGYAGVAVYISFFYVLCGAFTLTFDEKMPDGNLVVAVPNGMESIHHYAEPVAFFFRRDFSFDQMRTAESLSKIYGIDFQAVREANGQWVYTSDMYPGVEVSNIRYGFTESNYLSNDFNLVLTGKMLEKHREIFMDYGIELVPYCSGQNESETNDQRTILSVLVSEENKQKAAQAIAAFIQTTLEEDQRADGKSCWSGIDGSIYLVVTTETGSYRSIRNIPFSLKPEYTWIYDKNVTPEEIAENIVIKRETEKNGESDIPEYTEDHTEIERSDQDENSEAALERYLSIEPGCTFKVEGGMEYRMVPVDRALGSSFYVLIGTEDQGEKVSFINRDPYNGSGGESRWITFLDENVGFSCLAHAAGAYGSLYRTEDGGNSWEEIVYPSAKAKLPDGTYYNPFVMPEKVYEEDGVLYMEAGQGTDGDYYDSESGFCHGLYQSVDWGVSWEFIRSIPKER